MKKFLYLCGMMLLSLNMMAQIDLNDRNWETVFYDDFNTTQNWDINKWISLPDNKWKAYPGKKITHGNEHQIYQYDHCIYDATNGYMRLAADCDSIRIKYHNYALPDTMNGHYPNTYGQTNGLLYFSGEIDTRRKFRYGYFEIRCKLPVHQGAFPAFWLYSSSDSTGNSYYEEIDIFEYSWGVSSPSGHNPNPPGTGSTRIYTCGIYFNDTENDSHNHSYGRAYPVVPANSSDLDQFHTYGCKWTPDRVVWYFDGNIMNEYANADSIPHRLLTLKTDYAIDAYYKRPNGIWPGPGEMLIDYINVYQLKFDCQTDETITCQSDLENFNYAVKKTISVTSTLEQPVVDSYDKVTFRVTDSFEVTGPFVIEGGAEFAVLRQDCLP